MRFADENLQKAKRLRGQESRPMAVDEDDGATGPSTVRKRRERSSIHDRQVELSQHRSLLFRVLAGWRRLTGARRVAIDGVTIEVDPALPRGVKRALWRGDYEGPERACITRLLTPEDRVLEAGAGIGVVTTVCAARSAAVLTYEANPALIERIRGNLALNGLTAELRNRAIGVADGSLSFTIGDNFLSSSAHAREGTATEVGCDALAGVIEAFDPTVIVMDIEGAEIDVLSDALPSDALDGVRALVVELHPHVVGEAAIRDMLGGLAVRGFHVPADTAGKETVLLERRA